MTWYWWRCGRYECEARTLREARTAFVWIIGRRLIGRVERLEPCDTH